MCDSSGRFASEFWFPSEGWIRAGLIRTGRDLQFTAELSIVGHPPVARRSVLWIDGIS